MLTNSDLVDQREGDWMQTYTGRRFWPIDPRPQEVDGRDIARALSLLCRFGGHAPTGFYSVAEHSVLVSEILPEPLKLWGLLHDASEAYVADIVRPAKRFISGYAEVESRIMRAIAKKFDLPPEMPEAVKRADEAVLCAEYYQLGFDAVALQGWNLSEPPAPVTIRQLSPAEAEAAFLGALYDLTK